MIVNNIQLIVMGWFQLILILVHTQCSTSAHMCANTSNTTYYYFRERSNEDSFHYYKSNVTDSEDEPLENIIVDHTTVIFCTEAVVQLKVIHIFNKMNIALYGMSGGHTEVVCRYKSGYKFTNVTNLTLSNISLINCGLSVDLALDTSTVTTSRFSSVWFYFCENVRLTSISVRNSSGAGIAFVNTVGRVEVNNSSFENNNFQNKHSFSYGVYIKFSSSKLRKDVYKNHSQYGTFVFHKDNFINNSVSSYRNPKVYTLYGDNETNKQFRLGGGLTLQFEDNDSWYTEKVITVTNCTFKLNTGHHGGGISLNFTNSTTRNNVTIKHCDFTNNRADFGGGLSVIFSNNSNNCVLLSHIRFSENQAEMGGGAMELGFHFQQTEYPRTNNVLFKNCTIVANKAKYGGGTVLHYSRAKLATQKYVIKFDNCRWEKNIALFGSAVEASLHASDKLISGYAMAPMFKDCQFMLNSRVEEEYNPVDNDKSKLLTRLSWGKGVFFTTALPVLFKGNTTFFGSNTSALCLSSSIIEFAAGSNVNFTNNTGFEGGAINLFGLSEVHVKDNSSFIFFNNTVLSKGGAIIYRSGNKLDFVSSRRCFIQYTGNTMIVNERSIKIEFLNNSARALPIGSRGNVTVYGHSIYATTLIPCRRACTEQGQNNTDFCCIGNVTFWNKRSHEVSTDGAIFALSNESSEMTAIPGKEFELKFILLDENDKETYGSYHVTVSKVESARTNVILDPTYSYIRDKTIKLYGQPGQTAHIVVGTSNFRDIAVDLEVHMKECPPGFVTRMNKKKKGIECVCSANTVNKTYFGILRCELNSYQAYLIHGYWIGYDSVNGSECTLRSGYCPRGFCVRKKANETEILLPEETLMTILNKNICGEHRQGKLCGSCSNEMSVFYHSNSYYCRPNSMCRLGFFLYVVSEIIPVTLLFMIVLFFNVKFTSGALNGFIFFVQFIDTMLIDANGFISTHKALDTFMSIYLFTYRMFNLNFFTIDRLSFCLWEGANTLDIFAFKYVTVVYSIVLVVVTVLLKKFGKGKRLCFKNRNRSESSSSSVKSTMIHGFSAFLIMCYSQCAKVTLFILTPGRIHSIGRLHHNNITKVVFYHGDYKYLQGAHVKYALPTFIFGITLVLAPPLLLVFYPLCYKILALLHIEETRCINILCRILPLERMKPMFDSFQSCFKDKYRFFAGLYFLYRLAALLSFLITDSLTKFYIALEVQLIVMLTLQAIAYPYRRHWHNIIDVLLFANLAVINAMTMYNYKKAKERNNDARSIDAVSAIQTILVSTPFVCMVCFVIIQLALRIKRSRNEERLSRDEFTDTLALVDYRQLEDSKSLLN